MGKCYNDRLLVGRVYWRLTQRVPNELGHRYVFYGGSKIGAIAISHRFRTVLFIHIQPLRTCKITLMRIRESQWTRAVCVHCVSQYHSGRRWRSHSSLCYCCSAAAAFCASCAWDGARTRASGKDSRAPSTWRASKCSVARWRRRLVLVKYRD